MPVQTANSIQGAAAGLTFAAANLTWIIAPDVVVSSASNSGVVSVHASSTLLNHGIINSDTFTGVSITEDWAHVVNAEDGAINGAGWGVGLTGYRGRVQNLGLITGGTAGVRLDGEDPELDNAGYIYGYNNAVWVTADIGGVVVSNSGELNAYSIGINLTVAETSEVHNQGVISAPTAILTWEGVLELTNDGTVDGTILGAAMGDSVVNDGRMYGNLSLGGGADRVVNGGRIYGDIFLSLGNDVYDGRGGSIVGSHVDGGDGGDLLRGGGADDDLRGAHDADSLNGKGGDDELTGGRHDDRLTGGGGADTFVYLALLDSAVDPSNRDTITDFHRAEGDLIDLSALDAVGGPGNQAFDFIGVAAFSSTPGELRYGVAGGNALIQADVNGDGAADFTLFLRDVTNLNADDFAL